MQRTLVWMSTVDMNVHCLSFSVDTYNMAEPSCTVATVGDRREAQWSQWPCSNLGNHMGFPDWLESLFSVHKAPPTRPPLSSLVSAFSMSFHVGLHCQQFQIIWSGWRTTWSSLLSKTHVFCYIIINIIFPDRAKLSQGQVHSEW